MQVITDAQISSYQSFQSGLASLHLWAESVFAKDRIIDIVVMAANVSISGTILFSLNKAIQAYVYSGLGYVGFGNF